MRKVKVERELPFAKVGVVETLERAGYCQIGTCNVMWNPTEIQLWVDSGWLSWVEEEKSLEEALWNSGILSPGKELDEVCKIATDHFKEKFDKECIMSRICVKEGIWNEQGQIYREFKDHIRNALFK